MELATIANCDLNCAKTTNGPDAQKVLLPVAAVARISTLSLQKRNTKPMGRQETMRPICMGGVDKQQRLRIHFYECDQNGQITDGAKIQ